MTAEGVIVFDVLSTSANAKNKVTIYEGNASVGWRVPAIFLRC
jgi:hypothetical protein